MKSLSHVQLFVTPGTVAYQAPPSMGFSMQEYWTGLPFPSPGYLPNPGIEPRSPTLQADALPSEPPFIAKYKLFSVANNALHNLLLTYLFIFIMLFLSVFTWLTALPSLLFIRYHKLSPNSGKLLMLVPSSQKLFCLNHPCLTSYLSFHVSN